MTYGMAGVIGALAFGAAVGAVLPVPQHQDGPPAGRTELAQPHSADIEYAPPAAGS